MVMLMLLTAVLLVAPALAQDRVPADRWLRFADVAQAGFDAAALDAARTTWEQLPSSALLVIADGAVVAAWGDIDRRFMCHSVRKSFLSALYGIYRDRGELELNKTLAELGIDDEPSPLLESEQQARILDLLKARSAVYHPAAYAGRTDSAERGSIPPGQAFGYNNWDFNTLAAILMQETGDDLFESFDEHFGRPLGMQDWRISDGYYHYELDKSRYPAYPFRLSARDAARFGLLFARRGRWSEQRILSHHWVNRSTALYSIDSPLMGYGFMWWVLRKPSLEAHGMVGALGVGNQMIAALPESDIVIVNRANTYNREHTPTEPLMALVDEILAARTGELAEHPQLVPLEKAPAPDYVTSVPHEALAEMVGSWELPPASLELENRSSITLSADAGCLLLEMPFAGTFRFYLQPDGSLVIEDARYRRYPVRDRAGRFDGIVGADMLYEGALAAIAAGELERATSLLASTADHAPIERGLVEVLVQMAQGNSPASEAAARVLCAAQPSAPSEIGGIEAGLNLAGYRFLEAEQLELGCAVHALNTRLFPESANPWDSLGEAHLRLSDESEALRCYERSLELEPDNPAARAAVERLR